jgi:hypothetical protein
MSLSHLDLGMGDEPFDSEAMAKEKKDREAIYIDKKKEYFDESKFKNTDDVAKVPGLVPKQKEELDILKAQFRRANEIYLRAHPEIDTIISVFMCKLLEDKPKDVLAYAGEFFEK